MRLNTDKQTIEKQYIQHFRLLIQDYILVKQKAHSQFRLVKDFFAYHHTCAKTFLKYYNRYQQYGRIEDLFPLKRGPKYKTRRPLPFIEEKVKQLRELGNNRYEIVDILQPSLKSHTPSPSGVYNILKRFHMNTLTLPMKKEKRLIIKKKAGELGHIDCHMLNKYSIKNNADPFYFVLVIDDFSRIAWAELVSDIKSLTVMFATLKCLNMIYQEYRIKFMEVLTDNGPEFGTRSNSKKQFHPFERMLLELGIKHRYTRPYRPQTNGKAERFWRTLEDDMLSNTQYQSVKELTDELVSYLVYYNTTRPHQSLMGQSPVKFLHAHSLPN
jgi:hypothetical protein